MRAVNESLSPLLNRESPKVRRAVVTDENTGELARRGDGRERGHTFNDTALQFAIDLGR